MVRRGRVRHLNFVHTMCKNERRRYFDVSSVFFLCVDGLSRKNQPHFFTTRCSSSRRGPGIDNYYNTTTVGLTACLQITSMYQVPELIK